MLIISFLNITTTLSVSICVSARASVRPSVDIRLFVYKLTVCDVVNPTNWSHLNNVPHYLAEPNALATYCIVLFIILEGVDNVQTCHRSSYLT